MIPLAVDCSVDEVVVSQSDSDSVAVTVLWQDLVTKYTKVEYRSHKHVTERTYT